MLLHSYMRVGSFLRLVREVPRSPRPGRTAPYAFEKYVKNSEWIVEAEYELESWRRQIWAVQEECVIIAAGRLTSSSSWSNPIVSREPRTIHYRSTGHELRILKWKRRIRIGIHISICVYMYMYNINFISDEARLLARAIALVASFDLRFHLFAFRVPSAECLNHTSAT